MLQDQSAEDALSQGSFFFIYTESRYKFKVPDHHLAASQDKRSLQGLGIYLKDQFVPAYIIPCIRYAGKTARIQ